MILSQGHLGKFKVTGRKSSKFMPIHIFLIEKYWKFLLHIKIAYGMRMCPDFVIGSVYF